MANREVSEGRFSIIIAGVHLPFDEISTLLELPVSRIVHAGDVLNRLPEIRAQQDEWIHTVSMTRPQEADEALSDILRHLVAHQSLLKEWQSRYLLRLRFFVRSDHAQIGYRLMPQTLRLLADTGLPLDVHSLSWGEVDY